METRSEQSAATRDRILDATVEILAEVGAHALTVQAVAERADVALRTVYNHFTTKEELVVEAYLRLARATQAYVAAEPADVPPRERLRRFVAAMYESFVREGPGQAAILRVSGIPEFDATLARVRAWRRQELTKLLRAASRDGSLRVPVPEAVALAFLMTAYATWSSLVEESGLSPRAALDAAVRMLDGALFEAR